MKTNRGFELHKLKDVEGVEYTLQESSAALICTAECDIEGPFVWLGIICPEVDRMHLSQDQARDLAQRLLFFADNGYLEEKE